MAKENSSNWMPQGLKSALDSLRAAGQNLGTIGDFGQAFGEGMRVTPEDRRDMLWAIRGKEQKSEPPRVVQTLATQPSVDVLRQIKTIDPEELGRVLPVKPFNDDLFVQRARAGMNFGPNPSQIAGVGSKLERTPDQVTLETYKRALRDASLLKKAVYLGAGIKPTHHLVAVDGVGEAFPSPKLCIRIRNAAQHQLLVRDQVEWHAQSRRDG